VIFLTPLKRRKDRRGGKKRGLLMLVLGLVLRLEGRVLGLVTLALVNNIIPTLYF